MFGLWVVIGIVAGILIIIIGIIGTNYIRYGSNRHGQCTTSHLDFDPQDIAETLGKAVAIPTISYGDRELIDVTQFIKFHELLETEFPLTHQTLNKEVINQYSLLYRWRGKNPSLKPYLFMAHIDVVPVNEATIKEWSYEPFGVNVRDGYVWGRGSLDTKSTLICVMEAVERLLMEGFEPEREMYLAFGHDEEISGTDGATKIAEVLESRGVKLEGILDEGGIVTLGSVPGIAQPVGLIGIAEKGYLDLNVVIKGEGGHASTPPKSTALGQVAKVIQRLENHQMSMHLSPSTKEFLKSIGPYMGFVNRLILSNLWLFQSLFMKVFSQTNGGNALLRTTIAATMCEGSSASNVLPDQASATFNFRIASWNSIAQVIQHVKVINKDLKIEYHPLYAKEPSIVSSTETKFYKLIKKEVEGIFEDVIVAPYTVLAATDSVKYEGICHQIYRFAPFSVTKEELATIHNVNEHISVENLVKGVTFYYRVIKSL